VGEHISKQIIGQMANGTNHFTLVVKNTRARSYQ